MGRPKARYPWDLAPRWARWAAKDKDGKCCWYACRPERWADGNDDQWYVASGQGVRCMKFVAIHDCRVPGRWRQSLEQRPGALGRSTRRRSSLGTVLREAYEAGRCNPTLTFKRWWARSGRLLIKQQRRVNG